MPKPFKPDYNTIENATGRVGTLLPRIRDDLKGIIPLPAPKASKNFGFSQDKAALSSEKQFSEVSVWKVTRQGRPAHPCPSMRKWGNPPLSLKTHCLEVVF